MAASILQKSMRTSDYAFRIGGDEFALLLPQSDTEQAVALSRRLRAAYAASIEPLGLDVPLGLDYGLAVYPDDGEERDILIRVADERLYQLKNTSRVTDAAPYVRTSTAKKKENPSAPVAAPQGAPTATSGNVDVERRRWERVSLTGTRAYALVGEGVERTARVVDLGYGGVALETSHPEEYEEAFHAVLHVPILPPMRVSLRRIYRGDAGTGPARVGCAFVT